jgi:outer membrane protein assembly factor BamB
MLRLCNFFWYFLIAVLLVSGTAFSQRKTGEVGVSRCWQFPAENVMALATNGRDIFAGAEGGRVFAVSSNGEKLWQTELGGELVPAIGVNKGFVLVNTRSAAGVVITHQLSTATGVPTAASANADPPTRSAIPDNTTASASAGDNIILGDGAGLVTSLSGTGPVWKFKTGGAISAVVPVGDRFVVISRDNFIYALHARNGGLEWKLRMPGRIAHYAIGKGYLLVSSFDQHGASLIDLETGRIAGQIVLGSDDQVGLDPFVVADRFVISTNTGLSGYSLSGCGQKETVPKPPLARNHP